MKNKLLIMLFLLAGAALSAFSQNDLSAFDLKGNVRLCVSEAADNGFVLPSMRAEFSEEGTLVRLNGMDMTVQNGSYLITRDASKRIVRLEFSAGDADRINTFAYDGQGRISEVKNYFVNIDTDEEVLDTRMVRTYNAEGQPVKETYYNEDGSERAVYTYTYGKTDDAGNWLSRKVSEPSMGIDGEEENRQLSAGVAEEGNAAAASASAAPDASYDDALNAALTTKKSAGKGAKDWFWNILWGVLFLCLFVHTIYENYFRKPEFTALPDNGVADTPEEERLADKLHGAVEANVTSLQPLGVDDSTPVTREQLRNIKAAMREVHGASPRGSRLVSTYNAAVDMVNACEQRVFAGSKTYFILGIIVVGLLAVMRIFDGHILQGAAYFLFSFFAYRLGCKRQLYRVVGTDLRRPAGNKASKSAVLAVFGFMASSKTYITKYYVNGVERPELEDRDDSEHLGFGVIGLLALLLLGMMMPFVGLFNYLRFYVFSR